MKASKRREGREGKGSEGKRMNESSLLRYSVEPLLALPESSACQQSVSVRTLIGMGRREKKCPAGWGPLPDCEAQHGGFPRVTF